MSQFSFGQVSGTGDEATDGSPTLDVAVPVVINIIPPNALLSTDTIITISVTGGNATGRSMIIVVHYIVHYDMHCCMLIFVVL